MTKQRASNNTSNIILALGTLAAVIIVGGVLYQAQKTDVVDEELLSIPEQLPEAIVEPPAVPEANIPEIQLQPESEQTKVEQPKLPGLDGSDNFVRERVTLMSNSNILKKWLLADDLLRRVASYFDGLSRGVILSKIIPLSPAEGEFATHRQDGVILMNAGNYERYNNTVSVLVSLDMRMMAQMFHFSRPLLEKAFSELGYQPRQMDGIILSALDQVLNTPIIVNPIELTRDSVIYKFADSKLEALSPLQKQLIRSGPENTKRLQKQVKILRDALLNPQRKIDVDK
jgi:hypothetical protein